MQKLYSHFVTQFFPLDCADIMNRYEGFYRLALHGPKVNLLLRKQRRRRSRSQGFPHHVSLSGWSSIGAVETKQPSKYSQSSPRQASKASCFTRSKTISGSTSISFYISKSAMPRKLTRESHVTNTQSLL